MKTTFDRSQIPQAQKPRTFYFPEFDRFKLSNGLEIVFARHEKLPILAFQLVINSGANFDDSGKEGLASFVSDLIPEGTTTKSSFDFSHALEDLGTQFSTHADWNGAFLEMIAIKKQLQPSIDLLCDALFNPAFDKDEIERTRKRLLNQRLRIADNAGSIAHEKFAEEIYGKTRYGIPVSGNSRQIKQFSQDDVLSFYKKAYQPQNATLIIVGDLTTAEAKKLAEENFGKWQNTVLYKITEPQFSLNEQQKLFLVHKENAQQAEIRIGHLGVDRSNPDYFSVALLNQILGGYFLSRINLNLREDKGYTYGVSSRFITRKALGVFMVNTAVETKFAIDSVKEIIKEIENIQQEMVSDEELEQAKGYLAGIFPLAFESGSQIAAGLSNITVFNLEDDYYRTYRDKIAAVTKEQVWEAAKKYLHPQKLSIVVCTDKNHVEAEFEKNFDVEVSIYKKEK
ncbi:MAG: insulinase family protein [Calditrichaeota bacterium]|nr:MAG: insulinase family protein [Calditrichota bacterium]MBL1206537.1 insulinase family protein [Calditrichota bacterium]NOG46364.1 insulinase family protein [Calditrichota bacterium]